MKALLILCGVALAAAIALLFILRTELRKVNDELNDEDWLQ